ncbi:hypothetical protein BAUCODRAFT_567266 [Baudoinia panamericana UAMH 10762]|uniref:BTB domain-containing protein n=1 Tax=Baudoinia panamericana (strain UAMH 10762) TaxID=717646 RepID=M2NAM6_BAUPA|nr:uncharacterized protein BAUCODRAFT_567266 [Baudoinia panamericana UAMH 10762]EMD01284.1 hypothetical protein BAUCODRAFT_567266 [Baudoinia panamericana UAMH 10762]
MHYCARPDHRLVRHNNQREHGNRRRAERSSQQPSNEKRQTFHIHSKLISSHSPFFAAASDSSDWKEGFQRSDKLPDDSPEAMQAYVEGLYTDRFCCMSDMGKTRQDRGCLHHGGSILQDWVKKSSSNGLIVGIAYASTPANSPLRRLLVDMYAAEVIHDLFANATSDSYPPDFLLDLIRKLLPGDTETANANQGIPGSTRTYHHHSADEVRGGQAG